MELPASPVGLSLRELTNGQPPIRNYGDRLRLMDVGGCLWSGPINRFLIVTTVHAEYIQPVPADPINNSRTVPNQACGVRYR
jgi:hypothetical protein